MDTNKKQREIVIDKKSDFVKMCITISQRIKANQDLKK